MDDAIKRANDAILERMQGVPAQTMTQLEAMMDPGSWVQRWEANDNMIIDGETKMSEAPHGELTHQIRALKRHLRDLTRNVGECLDAIDAEMERPSTPERSKRIAAICNALNMSNDMAKRFGLGQKQTGEQR